MFRLPSQQLVVLHKGWSVNLETLLMLLDVTVSVSIAVIVIVVVVFLDDAMEL